MAFKLRGLHLPHNKNTDNSLPTRMDSVKSVTLPTSMHIGAPADITVKKGDKVYVGTLIAEHSGNISSHIYSSVSGEVTSIGETLLSNGKTSPCVVIESDGEMKLDENIKPPVINNGEDLLNALKQSGIVGLGGAGFPTFAKFGSETIEYLVINGAECEPYITSDSVTMLTRKDDIAYGLNMLTTHFNIKNVVIGIENNKRKAIEVMKTISLDNAEISVKVLPSSYPQGAEKVLVYNTTGKVIPMGKLPIAVGCVVCNSSTVAEIGKFLKTGIPLVERCITVDGNAVSNPQNVIVPIGTLISDVFQFCGGFKKEPETVLYGGPMMGVSVPTLELPVLKNTNALLAFEGYKSKPPKTTPCINCGACAHICPLGINPVEIAVARNNNDFKALEKAGTELCMECGCCSFVCPAKRPIVQNNKLAKIALREQKEKK